jgi:hypothetical protein
MWEGTEGFLNKGHQCGRRGHTLFVDYVNLQIQCLGYMSCFSMSSYTSPVILPSWMKQGPIILSFIQAHQMFTSGLYNTILGELWGLFKPHMCELHWLTFTERLNIAFSENVILRRKPGCMSIQCSMSLLFCQSGSSSSFSSWTIATLYANRWTICVELYAPSYLQFLGHLSGFNQACLEHVADLLTFSLDTPADYLWIFPVNKNLSTKVWWFSYLVHHLCKLTTSVFSAPSWWTFFLCTM